MTRADIAIIGGGVIGLSLAWRLAQKGARPVIVDSGDAQATQAAAGMLAPSFEHEATPLAEALYRFSAQSLSLWRDFARELEEESGRSIDYRTDGILGVAFRASEEAELRRSCDALRARGARVEWAEPSDVLALEPALSSAVRGGLFAPDDAQVDPRLTAKALTAALERRGVETRRGRVLAVEAAAVGASLRLDDGDSLEAGQAVVATGALARSLQLPGAALPVFPVKGELFALAAPARPIRRVVRAPGAYLCPKADGRLVIGATERKGETGIEPTEEGVASLRAAALRAAPSLGGLEEIDRWAGLRPGTPDAGPILGRDPARPESLLFALGHYRNGVLFAPATAAALASLLLGETARIAIDAFSPARFPASGAAFNH